MTNHRFNLSFTPHGWVLSRGRRAMRIRFDPTRWCNKNPWQLKSLRGMSPYEEFYPDILDAVSEARLLLTMRNP